MIHTTAIIDPKADLGTNVEIGPYSIIKGDVSIGSGTVIGSHVVIEPYVEIGPDCKVFQYAAIGAVPQSVKFEGRKPTLKSAAPALSENLSQFTGAPDLAGASQKSVTTTI